MESSNTEEGSSFYNSLQKKKTYADKFSRDEKIRAFDSIFELSASNFTWSSFDDEKRDFAINRRKELEKQLKYTMKMNPSHSQSNFEESLGLYGDKNFQGGNLIFPHSPIINMNDSSRPDIRKSNFAHLRTNGLFEVSENSEQEATLPKNKDHKVKINLPLKSIIENPSPSHANSKMTSKQARESQRNKEDKNKVERIVDNIQNLENKGITVKEMQEFRSILALSDSSVHNIVWFDHNSKDDFKTNSYIEKLEKFGFNITKMDDYKDLKIVMSYSLIITSPDHVDRLLKQIDLYGTDNFMGIMVFFREEFMRNYQHLKKMPKVLGLFEKFEDVFNYVVMTARFFQRINNEAMIIYCLGINHANYYINCCMADEYLDDLNDLPPMSLENFMMGNTADIAPMALINSVLKEYHNIIEGDQGNPNKAVEFLCKDERFMLRIFNSILRTQNLKFFRYISPFVKLYQDYFNIEEGELEDDNEAVTTEVYTRFQVDQNLIQDFIKYLGKEKYMFFPGIMTATLNRKNMINLHEPDYIYMSKTLFNKKENGKMPKLITGRYETSFKNEYMFPIFYPFKLVGSQKINNILEIFVTCPSHFYYNDEDISLLNETKENQSNNINDFMAQISEGQDVSNPFKKFNPFKQKRADLAYEMDFLDIFLKNFESYLNKEQSTSQLYRYNRVIHKAREYKTKNLVNKGVIVEMFDLLAITHKLRSRSKHQFNMLMMSMECFEKRTHEKGKVTLRYRILLASRTGKSYFCESSLTDFELSNNFSTYSKFFSSLEHIKEVYVNFTAIEGRLNDLIGLGTSFFGLCKYIHNPKLFQLNLNCNQFAINIFKEFITKNPSFKSIKQFYLKMDCCYLNDADLIHLASLTLIKHLEKLDISLERNKLTPSCLSSFLTLKKSNNLRELIISTGGNSFDEQFVLTLKENFKNIKFKMYEDI